MPYLLHHLKWTESIIKIESSSFWRGNQPLSSPARHPRSSTSTMQVISISNSRTTLLTRFRTQLSLTSLSEQRLKRSQQLSHRRKLIRNLISLSILILMKRHQ
jgi:hypothetical protein